MPLRATAIKPARLAQNPMLRKTTPALALSFALLALIWAIHTLINPERYYPYVAVQHPGGLDTTFIFNGHRKSSDCRSEAKSIADTILQSCKNCRVQEVQCHETLTPEQKDYLFADSIRFASSRIPQGTIVYRSENPELALSACHQSEIQTIGTLRRITCYGPGTPRNSNSTFSHTVVDDLGKAANILFIAIAGSLLIGWITIATFLQGRNALSPSRKALIIKTALILADSFVLLGVFVYQLYNGDYGNATSPQSALAYALLILFAALWFWAGAEHYSYRRPAFNEIREIFKALMALCVLAGAINFLIGEQIGRASLLSTWVFYAVILPVSRWSTRIMLDHAGCWQIDTVIVGIGKSAYNLYGEIANDGALGFNVVGFVSLSDESLPIPESKPHPSSLPPKIPAKDLLTNHSNILALIPEDELTNPVARQFVTRLYHGRRPPPLYHAWGAGPYVVTTNHPPKNYLNRLLKRAVDILVAATLLISLLPIVVAAAFLLWISEGRPIFYVSRRYVSVAASIAIPKFRSMVRDARSEKYRLKERFMRDGYLDIPLDCEVYTPVGRILERTQIVELPQLLCVLAGTMSLIGNRPLPHDNIVLLQKFGDWEKRFDSPAGLSGISQVVGKHFLTPESRLNLEILYSEVYQHGSVFLCDLAIIFYTVRFIATGRPLSVEKAINILLSCMPGGFRGDDYLGSAPSK